MKTLIDKVVVITGAGGSIAGPVADAFKQEGARVVLVDQDPVRIQGRANSLGTPAIQGNMLSMEDAERVMHEVKDQMLRLDGLVHLVGNSVTGSVHELSDTDYDEVFNSNVKTLFYAVKAALPYISQNDEGFIAGIASQAAWDGGAAGSSLFSAAKSAAATFLRSLNAELQDSKITVSVVFPMGAVDTLSNRQGLLATGQQISLIHPRVIAQALVMAARSGEGGSVLELPIYPPR